MHSLRVQTLAYIMPALFLEYEGWLRLSCDSPEQQYFSEGFSHGINT